MSGELDDLVARVADHFTTETSGDDSGNTGIGASGVDTDDGDGSARSSDSDLEPKSNEQEEMDRVPVQRRTGKRRQRCWRRCSPGAG